MKARWAELRSSVWHTKNIDAFIDSLYPRSRNGSVRNFDRWKVLRKRHLRGHGHGLVYATLLQRYSEPTWNAGSRASAGLVQKPHPLDRQAVQFHGARELVKSAVTAMRPSKAPSADNDLCLRTPEGSGYPRPRQNAEFVQSGRRRVWRTAVRPGEQWITLPQAPGTRPVCR